MVNKQQIQTFNLIKQGLARVLGDLEAEIMEVIWAKDEQITIKEVWEQIKCKRPIAFNTVMTVMNRLTDKELLTKEAGRKAYLFHSTTPKEQFLRDISRQVAGGLLQDFGQDVIVSFVEALDAVSPEYLGALEDLVRKKKDENHEDEDK